MILLGFEIGTGKRVEIPETGHLAWFGQTQLSGKTTALEAIAFRGGLQAVAFITKQGEGGFLTGRMIPPYFSEPTNDEEQPLWRWVKSILEASQQRKMNFEESWVIRACEDPRQAKTLADVHQNIKDLISGEKGMRYTGKRKGNKTETKWIRKPVSGINAGVYTSLKAYFDIVMPQLARLPYTKRLELNPGLNVMNLQEYAMETQALVIRSVMEWVYQHEKNVRIIVPEAQDFVPQGKNSPVKMACETLVRKAGANKNFMWLDSQDMAAVDKFALRACSIVGIGVQTEAHEIDRSLATMFSPSLKAIDIARLKIGEFFVRTSEARVSKVYVQPAWCDSEVHAQEIAKGNLPVSSLREVLQGFKNSRKEAGKQRGRETGKPHQLLQILDQEPPDAEEQEKTISRRADVVHQSDGAAVDQRRGLSGSGAIPEREKRTLDSAAIQPIGSANTSEIPEKSDKAEGDETMWREKYEALEAEHKALIKSHDALADRVRVLENYGHVLARIDESRSDSPATSHSPLATGNGSSGLSLTAPQLQYIYKYVKECAADDPGILELLSRRPELRVKVERQTIEMDDSTIIGRIARLVHDGYFKQPKNGPTVQKELKRRGCDQPTTNLYKPLNRLTEMGFLTLEPDGFQEVAEMKVQIAKA